MRLVLVPILLAVALPAQATLVVDASGRNGKYRTISAAVTAAKNGDKIVIHPGTYRELVRLSNKAVSLLGFTGLSKDVTIDYAGGRTLSIQNHPTGYTSTIRSLTVTAGSQLESIHLQSGAGDILFEDVKTFASVTLNNWRGLVSFANCTVAPPNGTIRYPHILFAASIRDLAFRDCRLFAGFQVFPFGYSPVGVNIQSSRVEMTSTSISGPSAFPAGSRYPVNGDYGLGLSASTARISGDAFDNIQGGAGNGLNRSHGGAGIVLQNSKLDWSGVSITGGWAGGGANPGPAFVNNNSTITKVQPSIPLLELSTPNPRGARATLKLRAWPRAVSMTWLSPAIKPIATPLGVLAPDFGQPHFSVLSSHDGRGEAKIPMDLRGYGVNLRGLPYVIQTFAVSTNNEPVLSTPWFGVLN